VRLSQSTAKLFPERRATLVIERTAVGAAGADASNKRPPGVVASLVLRARGQLPGFELLYSGFVPQPPQPVGSAPWVRQVGTGSPSPLRVDRPRGRPICAEQRHTLPEVPHARRHHPAGREHARHLTGGLRRVVERLHNELGEHGVEDAVIERQCLRLTDPHVDPGHTPLARAHVLRRRVDRCDTIRPNSRRQRLGQGAGTAANVERSHLGVNIGEAQERGSELGPVATDVAGIHAGRIQRSHGLPRPIASPLAAARGAGRSRKSAATQSPEARVRTATIAIAPLNSIASASTPASRPPAT
jgi:hypothetical protein